MPVHLLLAALILLTQRPDETLRAYGAADKTWRLTELDGASFAADAHITFPARGQIAGRGPCNGFTTTLTVPYPWFETGPIAATRRACPDLVAENAFLSALEDATLSEVLSDTLILSDDSGPRLVFKAAE